MLTLLCAHRAEAEAFVGTTQLKLVGGSRNLYLGDDFRLVIMGQGIRQCHETLERIGRSWQPGPDDIWLNFGVAGYGQDTPAAGGENSGYRSGELVLVESIESGGECWRPGDETLNPSLSSLSGLRRGGVVRTVSIPETTFSDPVLYDMEAAVVARHLQKVDALTRLVVIKLAADGPDLAPSQRVALGRDLLRQKRERLTELGAMLRSW